MRVVAEYGQQIPGLIDEIKARHVDVPKADWDRFGGIFFATAHKSKGLEFDQVWLTDDFVRFFKDGKEIEPDDVEPEEINILYVALTRAKAAIRIGDGFREWLEARRLCQTM